MSVVIKTEALGKKYIISHEPREPYTALRDVLMNRVRYVGSRILSPFRKSDAHDNQSREDFWALKDISFEIRDGDRVGIIGRNGAGKTTLLKILSRITEPTKGRIKIKGRVASLLEVGTGFHPELTGMENIFLNGAILGMSKVEINKKFDEIIGFAEVEKFLDTPVKRYSSGMHMRLAFAVAAHLDPEILIVDEVLAVGDAAFQAKCLDKMRDVGSAGRTVLFVSHNMGAIMKFCDRCIVLDKGQVHFDGDVEPAIKSYLNAPGREFRIEKHRFIGSLVSKVEFKSITINGSQETPQISPSSDIKILISGTCHETVPRFRTSASVFRDGVRLFTLYDCREPARLIVGPFESCITLPAYYLRPGVYRIALGGHDGNVYTSGREWLFCEDVTSFKVTEEWNEHNDFGGVGVVNLPHTGVRSQRPEAL